MRPISRRTFLAASAGSVAGLKWPYLARAAAGKRDTLLREAALMRGIPGIQACVVDRSGDTWLGAEGWADVANQRPMTPETIQNIASISKTVTATAVMQLVERRAVALDGDASAYLPFPLKHPQFADAAITVRHLLAHRSGIRDSPAYDASYACGDPTELLEEWIRSLLDPDGTRFHPRQNFIPRAPGERYSYSNVGYGVLGLIVEFVSGQAFDAYCKTNIFEPLSMDATGWYLRDVDVSNHAVPYAFDENGNAADEKLIVGASARGYQPLCLYSFPNYSDGLVRTSASDFAKFARAYLNGGGTILRPETTKAMWVDQNGSATQNLQGLCWSGRRLDSGGVRWGHDGGDPGVTTIFALEPQRGVGAAVFTNGPGHTVLNHVLESLLSDAYRGI